MMFAPDPNTPCVAPDTAVPIVPFSNAPNSIFGQELLSQAGMSAPVCGDKPGASIPAMITDAAHSLARDPGPSIADANDQAVGVAAFLHNQTIGLVVVTMTIAIALMGARIAWMGATGKGGFSGLEGLGALLAGYVATALGGAGAVALLVGGLNAMGADILSNAGNGDFEKTMADLIGNVPMGLGDIPAVAFGLLTWCAMGVQWLILHAVDGALPIAVGLWPLAFAVHGLWSPAAFKNRLTPLILTLATYKFIAMIIYAGGFAEITASTDPGGPSSWDGVLMLILAVAAFPIAYKVFAPWVGGAPLTGMSLTSVAQFTARAAATAAMVAR